MKQLFFIEGKYLGEASRGMLEIHRGAYAWPLSKLFFCIECGDVFAKCPTESTSWHAVAGCCRQCAPRSGQMVPGSIWHFETDFVAAFPDAVLRWEVNRHLDYAERQLRLSGEK